LLLLLLLLLVVVVVVLLLVLLLLLLLLLRRRRQRLVARHLCRCFFCFWCRAKGDACTPRPLLQLQERGRRSGVDGCREWLVDITA
jgi:hypothetical protein